MHAKGMEECICGYMHQCESSQSFLSNGRILNDLSAEAVDTSIVNRALKTAYKL